MSKESTMSKETKQTFWRWYFFGQAGWNYEKMQGLGYYYSMFPLMNRLYRDEKMEEMSVAEMQFFNTNNAMAPIILGIDNAIQEETGAEAKDAIAGLKTGLMGPMAGIGDTLFHVIPSTIIGSIASYMALDGNPIALVLWLLFGVARLAITRSFFSMGYREGVKMVTELGDRLKKITGAANILGITVIGGLIPSVVNATFGFEYVKGEVSISVQELADQIMPALAPALVVFLTYWLLGQKKLNSTRVTVLLIVLGILFYNLKIFA